ncbi:hypothetical protein DVH24_004056 [Malus domestica]|uniref:Uncharacterized protein n=1 Tax=Malus domestica TaxID=3750 RepID=A0A498KAM1_MALDO|nr:hypothetical protein DVH24_004056 [Malus domestica]
MYALVKYLLRKSFIFFCDLCLKSYIIYTIVLNLVGNVRQLFFERTINISSINALLVGKLGKMRLWCGVEEMDTRESVWKHCYLKEATLLHKLLEVLVQAFGDKLLEEATLLHKLFGQIAQQWYDMKDHELKFVVCMRCPKSYHMKCHMVDASITCIRGIGFEMGEGSHREGRLIARACEGLLPNRILIYCTPILRDHLKFPNVEVKKNMGEKKKKRKLTLESLVEREKVMSKKRTLPLEELHRIKTALGLSKKKQKTFYAKMDDIKVCSGFDIPRNVPTNTSSKKELKTSISGENKPSLGGQRKRHSRSIGDGSLSREKNWDNDTFQKLQHGESEKNRRGMDEISSVNKTDSGNFPAN